jgi:hypothetical protein
MIHSGKKKDDMACMSCPIETTASTNHPDKALRRKPHKHWIAGRQKSKIPVLIGLQANSYKPARPEPTNVTAWRI